MTVARAIRLLLAGACVCVVLWAFASVGNRVVQRWRIDHERPVTLTILHWGNAQENKIVQDLVDQYMRDNPRVRIVRIHASDFDSKLKTMMAAGTPPDLFYLPPRLLPELASLKLIEPIDAHVEAEIGRSGRAWFDDFFEVLITAYRYDAQAQRVGQGPLYGLPKDFTTAVFYINTNLFDLAGIDWKAIQQNGWSWAEFEAAMKRITALRGPLHRQQFVQAGVDVPAGERWTWEEYQAALKALKEKTGSAELTDRPIFGTVLQLWPDTIRQVLWTFGGDFFGQDFRDVSLDAPEAQKALGMIARLRLDDRTAFNATGIAKDGGQEFINGNIGSAGPVGRWMVPTYSDVKTFRWDVVPVPYDLPEHRASQLFMTAWTMSASTPHKEEAFRLMKFLSGGEGAKLQSQLGLAIPPLKSVANSPDFLSPPGLPPHGAEVFLRAIDVGRVQQIPREAEWERIVGDKITRSIQTGQVGTAENAREIEEAWLAELNSPLRRQQWTPLNWNAVLMIGGAILAVCVALLWWKAAREPLGPLDRATERAGYLFISPWLIGFACLTLGPMLLSLILSFTRWSAMVPLQQAEAVGLANYEQLFTRDPTFAQSLRVTGYYVLLAVPVGQLAALGVAMLMNQKLSGIAVFRTIYFVPSVVSGAALSVLWLQIYNNDYGIMNQVLRPLLRNPGLTLTVAATVALVPSLLWLVAARRAQAKTGDTGVTVPPAMLSGIAGTVLVAGLVFMLMGVGNIRPPNWFGTDPVSKTNDAMWWAVPGFVIMNLWGVGSGMIIYLAGLKGIPTSLYEAATVDGAGPLGKFWNVTLPMLSPLIFYNLIMGIIGSFQVFTQAYMMTGAGPDNATLFYVLQLYRQAFEFHNMGYASAMAWVLFVIVLLLTLLVFRWSRGWVHYEGLKA